MSKFMDELMSEHIRLPGVPQLIVTRDFAWKWMKKIGCDPYQRGFASMEYAVMSQKAINEPLTNLKPLQRFLRDVMQSIRRDCLGVHHD